MLNILQLESINLNLAFIAIYLVLLITKQTAARLKVSVAAIICVAICYSPLYTYLNNTQYYSLFAIIYVITCINTNNKKVSATCCIMAIFDFLMVMDRIYNAGIETWLYVYYEEITAIIHSLIMLSFVKWQFNWRRGVVGFVLSYVHGLLRGMRYTTCLCYACGIK